MKLIPHAKHLLNLWLKLKTGFVDFQELLCCAPGGKAALTLGGDLGWESGSRGECQPHSPLSSTLDQPPQFSGLICSSLESAMGGHAIPEVHMIYSVYKRDRLKKKKEFIL